MGIFFKTKILRAVVLVCAAFAFASCSSAPAPRTSALGAGENSQTSSPKAIAKPVAQPSELAVAEPSQQKKPAAARALASGTSANVAKMSDDEIYDALSKADSTNISLSHKKLMDILRDQQKFFERVGRGSRMREAETISAYRRLRSLWEEYLLSNPDDIEASIIFGKFLRRVGDGTTAYGVFCEVEKKKNDIHVVKQQLATYEGEIGMWKESYEHLQQAMKLSPDNPVYLTQFAQLILVYRSDLKDFLKLSQNEIDAKMLDAYARVARLLPNDVDAQTRYAQAFYDLASADWNAAYAQWLVVEKMTTLNVERQNVWANRARVLVELNRDEEAEKLLRQVTLPSFTRSKAMLLGEIERARQVSKNAESERSEVSSSGEKKPTKNTYSY